MNLTSLLAKLEASTAEQEEEGLVDEGDALSLLTWAPGQPAFFGPLTRHISISGPLTEAVAVAACGQIQELTIRDHEAPITIHINTPGGSIVDALAIYDMCKVVTNPIIAIVNGGAMSAGLLILSAADFRLATPNSMFFYHQPIMSEIGVSNLEEADSISELYNRYQLVCDEIVRTRSKITKTKWKRNFANKTSYWFGAEEALAFGLIDDLLEYTKKPKMKLEDFE